ncbi:MAG: DUF4262 domain-containing protein [Bacteroidetes bacterium]|nr:DUF4262 domain-containing protein [Bacteroidota bacterium]
MLQSFKDEYHRKISENIEKYGLAIQPVFGDEENPQFSYSIGLYRTYRHPEIIMLGLNQELMSNIIDNIAEDIKNGKTYDAYSWSTGLLKDFECYFIEVDKANYGKYVLGDIRLYGGNNFPLLQCVWPTTEGIYPWEDAWPDDMKKLQPLLGPINKP